MNKRQSLYDVSSFYNKKAVLNASFGGMRYQVEQAKLPPANPDAIEGPESEEIQVLRGTVWPEPFCFEKTAEEKKTIKDFVYTEEGLDQLYDWLCEQYSSRQEEWQKVLDNPYEGLF